VVVHAANQVSRVQVSGDGGAAVEHVAVDRHHVEPESLALAGLGLAGLGLAGLGLAGLGLAGLGRRVGSWRARDGDPDAWSGAEQ